MSLSTNIVEYEVLYYKRTNKVHKSKGVSKSDGVLRITPDLQKVSLFQEATAPVGDDQGNQSSSLTIASSINKEISERDLQEDDTIVLGAFDVQIVGRKGGVPNRKDAASRPTTSQTSNPMKSRFAGSLHKKPSGLQSRSLAQRAAPRQPMPLKRAAVLPMKQQQQQQHQPDKEHISSPSPSSQKTFLSSMRPSSAITKSKLQPIVPRAGLKRSIASTKPAATSNGALSNKQPARLQTGLKRSIASMKSCAAAASASSNTQPTSVLPHIPLPATLAQALRPHQVTGVDFIWNALGQKRGCILADDTGLGKTCMTIAVIAAMHRQERSKQFIIVCPSSLVNNWAHEFDKWIGKAGSPKRVVITKGGEDGLGQIKAYCSKMKQNNQSNQNGQVLIISYDLLRLKAAEQFQSMAQSFKLLVVDEGHRLKNSAGSLTLTALESIQCDARLCITATPIQNNLSEFYTLANFSCPGCLGDLQTFRRNYERPIAASSGPDASRQQIQVGAVQSMELDKITGTFMLRRLQKDILKTMLPPRSEFLLFCRPSAEQEDLYHSITQDTRVNTANAEALVKLTALRKLCLHPELQKVASDGNTSDWSLAQSGKLVVVDALLQSIRSRAPNDKIVLVSNYTSALSAIESLILQPREYTYSRLDGGTNVQDRQSLVDSFNRATADRQFCMLLSSKAGGVGLNLIGANRLIMLDADWNPSLDIQCLGRIYRQGQSKPTFMYRFFTSGTIEEVIYQRQSSKGNLANMAVDGKASTASKGFTKEELADCFTLKKDCSCDTKSKLGSRWPEYTGPDGLDTTDTVLLDLVGSMEERIGHIHIVQDDELTDRVNEPESLDEHSLYDSDDEEEMEFQ